MVMMWKWCVVSDSNLVQDTSRWRDRFEELPKTTIKPLPSSVEAPKLDLKPLPTELKYAYLGQDETFPVIISSSLGKNQNQTDRCSQRI